MKYSELHRWIKRNGWTHIRTTGSHYIYEKGNITYPVTNHGSKEIYEPLSKENYQRYGAEIKALCLSQKNKCGFMEVIVKIGASKDHLGAYAEGLAGVTAGGDTLQEVKRGIEECIALQIELGNVEDKEYQLVYQYDTQSFLRYYSRIFTMSALERLTGINQKQLHHYIMGKREPRESTKQKITAALHQLGHELIAFEL